MTEAEEAQYNAMVLAFETERAININLKKDISVLVSRLEKIADILEGNDADDI